MLLGFEFMDCHRHSDRRLLAISGVLESKHLRIIREGRLSGLYKKKNVRHFRAKMSITDTIISIVCFYLCSILDKRQDQAGCIHLDYSCHKAI